MPFKYLVAYGTILLLWIVAACPAAGGQSTTAVQQQPSGAGTAPVLFGTNVDLQGSPNTRGAQLGLGVEPQAKKPKDKKRKGEFAVAPIPLVNPSIGNGGGLGVLYAVPLGENDTSPPSSFGAGGFGTGRGSWGLGLGARLYLRDDNYRITVGGGGGEINYNYFGTGTAGGSAGISIPLSQRSRAFLIEPKIRVFREWFVGPRYHLITNQVSLGSTSNNPSKLPIPPPSDLHLRTAAFGGRAQRDTSDSPFYPRKGSIFDTLFDIYGSAVGGQRQYENLTISFNKYVSVGNRNVFAIHGLTCLVTDNAPFYDVCELGESQDLRGYQVGQFRDNRMLVGQAEYRRELVWRLGVVAFAGAGAVAHTWSGFGDTQAEPGGGFGLRYVLAKRNHINLRADYAWGSGSHATYISLGEAF